MATIGVKRIVPFDAATDCTVTFVYSGDQCLRNKITVYDNATNDIVFEDTVVSMSLSHTIPASTLNNGQSYYCTITAYWDRTDNTKCITSSRSDVFLCLHTPIFEFENLAEGDTVASSTLTLSLNYEQANGELLNEYRIQVYNHSNAIIFDSGVLYDSMLSATIYDLADNEEYYLLGTGETVNGLSLSTGRVGVSVNYSVPSIFSTCSVENEPHEGIIKITSNVASIDGQMAGAPEVYIDDKRLDLTLYMEGADTPYSMYFDEGLTLPPDFTLEAKIVNPIVNKPDVNIITLGTAGYLPAVCVHQGTFDEGEMMFAALSYTGKSQIKFCLISNMIPAPLPNSAIHIWLRRHNGMWALKIADLGVAE